VKEQSQIEDMRAALRGERERAEQARARSSENVGTLLESTVVADPAPPPEPRRRGFRGRFGRR